MKKSGYKLEGIGYKSGATGKGIKAVLNLLLLTFYLLPVSAQIPARWDAEASSDAPYSRTVYRGESLALAPQWTAGGAPLDTSGWAFTAYWSTNGLQWWSKALGPDPALTIRGDPFEWSPDMDTGARQYRLFIRAENPGGSVSYRANARLTMLDSPGLTPNQLPLPVQRLDFAAVAWTNAPWALQGAFSASTNALWGALAALPPGMTTNDVRGIVTGMGAVINGQDWAGFGMGVNVGDTGAYRHSGLGAGRIELGYWDGGAGDYTAAMIQPDGVAVWRYGLDGSEAAHGFLWPRRYPGANVTVASEEYVDALAIIVNDNQGAMNAVDERLTDRANEMQAEIDALAAAPAASAFGNMITAVAGTTSSFSAGTSVFWPVTVLTSVNCFGTTQMLGRHARWRFYQTSNATAGIEAFRAWLLTFRWKAVPNRAVFEGMIAANGLFPTWVDIFNSPKAADITPGVSVGAVSAYGAYARGFEVVFSPALETAEPLIVLGMAPVPAGPSLASGQMYVMCVSK